MKMSKSSFAKALSGIMVETNIGSLKTWGFVLSVRESTIKRWLNDQTFPSPKRIKSIICNLKKTIAVNSVQLKHFESLYPKPLGEITPLAKIKDISFKCYLKNDSKNQRMEKSAKVQAASQ